MSSVLDRPSATDADRELRADLVGRAAKLLPLLAANARRAHGGAGFAESSPLQRIWRHSEVASRHAVAHPEFSAEVYGKLLLGIRGDVTPLV